MQAVPESARIVEHMKRMKSSVSKVPLVKSLKNKLTNAKFEGSEAYWEQRYAVGGTSGAGSAGILAEYKAKILNAFVAENNIKTVLEFGCGDGNQLKLAQYPSYVGLDVSRTILQKCALEFESDKTKSFFVYDTMAFVDNAGIFKSDMAMSLDVIYHLVEDDIYLKYMQDLFASGKRFVAIYSSNKNAPQVNHLHEHCFTDWISSNAKSWKLAKKIDNPYPYDPADPINTSISDFYFFENTSA
jgi:SAM-dependent methyltransferase